MIKETPLVRTAEEAERRWRVGESVVVKEAPSISLFPLYKIENSAKTRGNPQDPCPNSAPPDRIISINAIRLRQAAGRSFLR